MKNTILILLALSLSSCKNYYLKKYCDKKDIETITPVDTTLKSKSAEVQFEANCDSLIARYDSLSKANKDTVFITDTIRVPNKPDKIVERKGVLIHSDSVADVYYSINSKGNLSFKVITKPQNVRFKADIKGKATILQPNFKRTWLEELHAARWYVFIAFILGFMLAMYLKLRN